MMFLNFKLLILAMTAFASTACGQETLPDVMSPQEIWQGYDPRAEPLNEEVLKTWQEDGVTYKEFFFNGEKFDGKYVRIYGIYAAPTGGKNLPALLHIHGGGQTVNKYWLKEFTGRGYAVLTYNWGGEWPNRKMVTQWNDVQNGSHRNRARARIVDPTPRADAYFLWTQAAMRCVTYLEKQPEVDPEKIGAFGISMGGTIMWNLAFDSRIKAGCAIYGSGWNTYSKFDPKYAIGHPQHEPSENDLRWRASLSPEASAPFIQFPMLFLSSSNDHHGYLDRAEDSLNLIPDEVPRAWGLTPRFRHHIGPEFVKTLPAWMDFHLKKKGEWPADPVCKIEPGKNGVPVFYVHPDDPENVVDVKMFYSRETPFAVGRHWTNAKVTKVDKEYRANTPVVNANEYLFAYANITYSSGVVISSPFQAVIPEKIEAVATVTEPSRLFYDGAEGVGDWTCNSPGTDPIPAVIRTRLKAVVGPDGKPGFTAEGVNPMNYAPSDPEFRAPQGASLQFDIKTEVDETFTVMLHKNYWVDGFTSYAAKVDIAASPEWQTVKLAGTDFVDEKSDAVLGDSINEIGQLGLMKPKGQTWQDPKIIFRNFRWVGGQYVPHVHAYRNPKRTKVAKDRTDLGSDDAKNLVDHEAVKLDALITDLKFDSEHQYRLVPAGLKVGETLWTDRKLKVVSLPEGLVGADCLKTPMVDRSNRSEAIIKFTTKRNCTVYVGIKEGSENLPEWLSAWEATDEKVNAVNTLVLYRKRFSKDDRVTLGSIHRQGIHAMYTVFVKAE